MGKFEKLVVLSVLFLSAIVLAISLNDGRKKAEPGSPVDVGRSAAGPIDARSDNGMDAGMDARTVASHLGAEPATLLLSTEVIPSGAANAGSPAAAEGESASILRDTSDLRKAGLDDYMVYTAAAGDTWAGLAERFYGSGRYVTLLRHANEDMVSPLPGETILVPARDFAAEAGRRAPLAARENGAGTLRATPSARDAGLPARDDSAAGGPAASGLSRDTRPASVAAAGEVVADLSAATSYEVRAGDSLTGIAQRVYGSASRWNVLFEANRSLLHSPDWLQVGMQLTVPRGAALQTLASAAVSAPEVRTDEPDERKQGKVR